MCISEQRTSAALLCSCVCECVCLHWISTICFCILLLIYIIIYYWDRSVYAKMALQKKEHLQFVRFNHKNDGTPMSSNRNRNLQTLNRAFSVVGPLVWNGLPLALRSLPKVFSQKFLQQLKTTLFFRAGVEGVSE